MRTITLLLLALVLVAGAATVTFQPDPTLGKDALVSNNYPNRNYGDHTGLHRGYGSGSSQWRTYIEFTELNDPQYQGATVTSAILSLYVYDMNGDTTDAYFCFPLNSSWDESTITWNNVPTSIGSAAILQNYPSGIGWIDIDITAWVPNWLDGTWTNNGCYLRNHNGSSITNDIMTTHSSDYTDDSSLRPKLVMEYSGSAVEEATWGQIKATF